MLDFNYDPAEMREILVKYGSASPETFNYGNTLIRKYQKMGVVSEEPADLADSTESNKIVCDIYSCKQEFQNVSEFESHWRLRHYYNCKVCKLNLPSEYSFLELFPSFPGNRVFCRTVSSPL
jgi:hypothetical protein